MRYETKCNIMLAIITVLFSLLFVGYTITWPMMNENTTTACSTTITVDEANIIDPREAVVIITDGMGHGSGVHIGDGIILTAGHCINIPGAWVIANDGRTYSIIDQWADPYDEDIGFMRIRNAELPALGLGDMPVVGDTVWTIGTPFNLCHAFNMTKGIVSDLHVDLVGWWYDMLITDAAIYPGNSGGPIINAENEIVAIVVGSYVGYDNLSICEPVENIRWSFEAFLEYLER